MTKKEKEQIDTLFENKKKHERNLKLENTNISPTKIIIRVMEKKENAYIGEDLNFDDRESIELILELVNALLLKEKKELEEVKRFIEKIKIDFS